MTDLEIVQEAQKLVEHWSSWQGRTSLGFALGYPYSEALYNSWLAHKAFFERHKRLETNVGDLCEICEYSEYRASYPCPELVAQARLILGVAND